MKRIIFLITLACFLTSFILPETLHAVAALPYDEAVPAGYGRITETWTPPGAASPWPTVINIQDLHCHAQVQRNIAGILSNLDSEYGLDKIYVEGGYGRVDTSRLIKIKNSSFKTAAGGQGIIENLIDSGRLTGAEYYSICAGKPDLLYGIEDKRLHRENLSRLGKIMARRQRCELKLREFERDLQFMQARYCSAENRKFDKVISDRRKGVIKDDDYYRILLDYVNLIAAQPEKYAAPVVPSIEDYPQISARLEVVRLSRRLKYKSVPKQLAGFVNDVKSQVTYSVYNELIAKTDNFNNTTELYIRLARLAGQLPPALSKKYPDLYSFLEQVEKNTQLNPLKMIEEEKRLTGAVRLALAKDVSELEVSFILDFFGCFRDYLLAQLAADDYEYFVKHFDRFMQLWAAYAFHNSFAGLAADFELLDDYYRVNSERNNCFIRNIVELKSVKNKADAQPQVIVLITGGFHTSGLKAIFRERGIPYVTIMPDATKGAATAHHLYERQIRQQEVREVKTTPDSLALALSAQLSSPQLFETALKAANRELSGIRFTRANFDEIMKGLAAALGAENIVSSRFDDSQATVTFSNGRTVTLAKTIKLGAEVFEAGTDKDSQAIAASRVAMDKIAVVLSAGELVARDIISLAGLIPGAGSGFMNIMKFAAEHNLVLGDGLIYEIENDDALKEMLADELENLYKMPPLAQRVAATRARRQRAIAADATSSELIKSLMAVAFVRDFIVSTSNESAGEQKPLSPEAGEISRLPWSTKIISFAFLLVGVSWFAVLALASAAPFPADPAMAQNAAGNLAHFPQVIIAALVAITGAAAMTRIAPSFYYSCFIKNILVKPGQAAYFKAYRNRINRDGLSLKGRYAAAGPDISSVLYIFDPSEVEFIDRQGYNGTHLQQLVDEWDNTFVHDNFAFRYKAGYWPKQLTRYYMEELLLAELQALGVKKSDVMPVKVIGNGEAVLSFWWAYPGENSPRLRNFILKKGDITNAADYAPVDFYFQKAAMEVNEKIKEFINSIARSSDIVLISPFTTNEISQLNFQIAWSAVTTDWESGKHGFAFEQRFASINRKFRQRLVSVFEDRYGWKLELWQKKSTNGLSGAAILPENLGRVNRWANEGKSPFAISVRIALLEFFASLNFPGFVAAHTAGGKNKPHKDSAARKVAQAAKWGGIILFAVGPLQALVFGDMAVFKPLTDWFMMGNYIIGDLIVKKALEFIAGAFVVSVPVHVYLDYHYLKSSGLHKAIRKFGAAELDENGRVHTNVYIVDSPVPHNSWENVGMQVDGRQLYASVDSGAIVVYTGGASSYRAGERLAELLSPRGRFSGSRRLNKKFRESTGALEIDARPADFRPGIIVDHGLEGESITYNIYGSMVVSPGVFANAGELLSIRNSEAFAMGRNVFINMDKLSNLRELADNLDVFASVGNGQMVVSSKIFERYKYEQIVRVLRLANANNIRIYVDVGDDVSMLDEYRRMWFAGYVKTTKEGTEIHDFAFYPDGRPARRVNGYPDAIELRNKMAAAGGSNIILDESELRILLSGGERSPEGLAAIPQFLKAVLPVLFKPDILSVEFVAAVAYGRDNASIPELPGDIGRAVKAFQAGTPEQIVSALGAPGLGVYVRKIASDLKGASREQNAGALQKAYLAAIFERMLFREYLKRADAQLHAGYENGTYVFSNPCYEKMLGALLAMAVRVDYALPANPRDAALAVVQGAEDTFAAHAAGLMRNYDELMNAAAPAREKIFVVISAILMDIYEDYRIRQLGAGSHTPVFNSRSIEQTLRAG